MSIWTIAEFKTIRLNPTKSQLKAALKTLEGCEYPYNSIGSYDLFAFSESFNNVGFNNRTQSYFISWYGKQSLTELSLDEITDRIWQSKIFRLW